MRYLLSATLIIFGLLTVSGIAVAAISDVPEVFQGSDESSKYTIRYDDLTDILSLAVVNVGRSTREVAAPRQADTGTRMKMNIKRTTNNEGNRFYFETFKNNEEARKVLIGIQKSLEALPDEAALKYFSRDEQLVYWLNLYNVTMLNELIQVYPKRNLKKILLGKKSIKSNKVLNVAGIPLSLDDIQYTILKNNYDNDPLIIYGLYQGIIGGPNIRGKAYTRSDVWRALKNNANEFVNSNRGTYSGDAKVFQVSSLYGRNRAYFPDFQSDLSKHILTYVEGDERVELHSASTLKPNIDDWTITDLGGTDRNFGAQFATNNAALLDSIKSTVPGDITGVTGAASGYGSASLVKKTQPSSRFSPDLLVQLHTINEKRESVNMQNATVTVEELGEVPVEPQPEPEPDSENKDEN
jgi:hypothetical protein